MKHALLLYAGLSLLGGITMLANHSPWWCVAPCFVAASLGICAAFYVPKGERWAR